MQTGVPGLGADLRGGHQKPGTRYDYEPAHRAADGSSATAPIEETWDTRAYLTHMPGVFAKIREDFGTGLRILHDGHHRMTPIEAARFAKDVEPYDLFWLEDCTPGEDQAALRLVRQHSTTPLAIGEVFNSVYDYQSLITERLIDYVRSAVTHTGGVTAMKKLLDFAGIYGIKSGMHGPTDISPSAWPLHCTSTWRSTTSVSRSTCRTVTPRWTFSRRRTHSTGATCIRGRRPDSVSNSTSRRRRHSSTPPRTSP